MTSDQVTSDKEGRNPHPRNPRTKGVIGQLRKDKRASGGVTLGATKNPAGVILRGAAGVLGLSTVARKGGQNEKDGEQ